jgi:hypothetical protein
VVYGWPHLMLVTTCGDWDAPHAGATRVPIIVVVMVVASSRRCLSLFLPPLAPSLPLWIATSDGSP